MVNVPDNETLHRMMAEMPFSPGSDIRMDPFVEGEAGFAMAQEIFQSMMQSMSTQGG